MRSGLVKKLVNVKRGGKTFQQTRWVRPKEHQSAQRKQAKVEHKRSNTPIMQRGAKPPAPPTKEEAKVEAEGAETIARRAKVMGKFKRLAPGKGIEAKPSKQEAVDILEVGRFALVSAGANWNDESEGEKPPEFFAQRHEELRKQLVADGFQFTQIKGKYKGGEEDSFLVWIHDADRETTKKLGEMYNQDSVIYGENGVYESHYTTGDKKGEMEESSKSWVDQEDVTFDDPKYADDFYSEVPLSDGSSFKFKLRLFEEGAKTSPYGEKGSRREFLYGVDDDGGKEEQLSRLKYARARKKR